ncbi:hypothetical protein FN846DRAFT_910401 [Sphaerosporella brunnea]|uniref:Uncharacterized protein n=1 Tax=Sphaerosporella brunnea TaxID=1250544 RepID=A0A5J5EN25_9PEZI|nr:hypothetical protein FN846DRAFT_910401 [Sphaerosporella brunnea]
MSLQLSSITSRGVLRPRVVTAVVAFSKLQQSPARATALPACLPTAISSSGVLNGRRNFASSGPLQAKRSPWVIVKKQRQEIAVLFKKLDVIIADNATLKADNATLKADNATLKADNATLKADNATLKADNATLKADNATLRADNAALRLENANLKETIDTLIEDNKDLRAENAQLRLDFATVVDRVHHPISCAICTKYWWKHFVLPAIEPDPLKLQRLQAVAFTAYSNSPNAGYFRKKITDWPAVASRAGMSEQDLRDRVQKLDLSRIHRNVVAHEVTPEDIRVAIKYARDGIEEELMRWSFGHFWGVTPEAYDVLGDVPKQQLLKKRMCNMSDEQMEFLHLLLQPDTT